MAETGRWVGGFRLVRKLGQGGFGAVYLGEDASGGRVAVKLLHPHLAEDAQQRAYFARELAAARQVQEFCLAEILGADLEAAEPWIATEYIEGPTLGQAVRADGPRTGGDLRRLAVQIITALSAIHAAGVVHRDLKPANIVLGSDGPRVIDFGIARALDAETSSATQIGTVGYMAPEQLEGSVLGPSADLFAWGAVVIFAATGADAFPGPTQAARITRVLTQPPDTGDLADPLLGVVLACMDKEPQRRPAARQVLDMLLTGATAPPIVADAPPAIPDTSRSTVAATTESPPDATSDGPGEDQPDETPDGPGEDQPDAVDAAASAASAEPGRATRVFVPRRYVYGALAAVSAIVVAVGVWLSPPDPEPGPTTSPDEPRDTISPDTTVTEYTGGAYLVRFSPDGSALASSGYDSTGDETVRLWDLDAREEIASLDHEDVGPVQFSPDGETLATADWSNKNLRLWDRGTGEETGAIDLDSAVSSMNMTPDGKAIATGHEDGTVRLHDVS